MEKIIRVMLKIIFFPAWVVASLIFYIGWVVLIGDYNAWKRNFVDRYFKL